MSDFNLNKNSFTVLPEYSSWIFLANENRKITGKNYANIKELYEFIPYCVNPYGIKTSNGDHLFFFSGHQPDFCHPGIWFKYYLLHIIQQNPDPVSFNIGIDYETINSIELNIPCFEKYIFKKNCALDLRSSENIVSFKASKPSSDEWKEFIKNIFSYAGSLKNKNISDNLNKFYNVSLTALNNAENLYDFLTLSRRLYDGLQYNEFPGRLLCKLRSFLDFFMSISHNIKEYHKIYNSLLKKYRVDNKIRNKANPFPDLTEDKEIYELPFWYIDQYGLRKRLFINNANDLICEDHILIKNIKDVDMLYSLMDKNNSFIVPKALTLTSFIRLKLADFFIHGKGGSKYEIVGNNIIKDFFKIPPPDFATCSISLGLDIKNKPYDKKAHEEINEKIKLFGSNPEKIMEGAINTATDELATKKRSFLDQINSLETTAEEKKQLASEIKKINLLIKNDLIKEYEALKNSSEEMKIIYEENQNINHRDYPFFLFNIEEIFRLMKKNIK